MKTIDIEYKSNLFLMRLQLEIQGLSTIVYLIEDEDDRKYYYEELAGRVDYRDAILRKIVKDTYPEENGWFRYNPEEGRIYVYDKA